LQKDGLVHGHGVEHTVDATAVDDGDARALADDGDSFQDVEVPGGRVVLLHPLDRQLVDPGNKVDRLFPRVLVGGDDRLTQRAVVKAARAVVGVAQDEWIEICCCRKRDDDEDHGTEHSGQLLGHRYLR